VGWGGGWSVRRRDLGSQVKGNGEQLAVEQALAKLAAKPERAETDVHEETVKQKASAEVAASMT